MYAPVVMWHNSALTMGVLCVIKHMSLHSVCVYMNCMCEMCVDVSRLH